MFSLVCGIVGSVAALTVAMLAGAGSAAAGAGCGTAKHGSAGYAYAGHQADRKGHGIRATLTAVVQPNVQAGHAAGWVGVGGRGEGPNGSDSWLQVGIALLPNTAPLLYAEITRPSSDGPVFMPIETELPIGASRRIAVLEISKRPGWWRVWVQGKAVTEPIHLPGSAGKWQPIATAETWNGGQPVCNRFAFRFDGVGVAAANGGSWRAFVPGFKFQDNGFGLRSLTPAKPTGVRTLAGPRPAPYAFEARRCSAPAPRLRRSRLVPERARPEGIASGPTGSSGREGRLSYAATMRIGVPTGIRSRRKFAVSFDRRTQPCETA